MQLESQITELCSFSSPSITLHIYRPQRRLNNAYIRITKSCMFFTRYIRRFCHLNRVKGKTVRHYFHTY